VTAVLAAPLVLCAAALRPRWRKGWRDRLGRAPRQEPGAVWVHSASVGEALASLPLHDALARRGWRTLASATTLTGREVLRGMRPELPFALAPLDHPWCVDRALDRVGPAALVLVETELWPVWIASASRRGIPVVIVSGRLSDRAFPRYRRLRFLWSRTLSCVAAVGARSQQDAERFRALGMPADRIEVTGDLKLEPRHALQSLKPDLEAFLADVTLLVAGSTHPGEEAAALQAQAEAERAGHDLALVLAPRYPERADEVERLALAAGRTVHRRSRLAGGQLGVGEVLLLDSVGELAGVYSRCHIAFVGGSLIPRGGHNVLEPLAAGCPVIFGPHTHNARESVELAIRCGAGQRAADTRELVQGVLLALADPAGARLRGAGGRTALEHHRGAAARSSDLVERALRASESAG
jgi:3-deoxy-D-manno-octulosonic-acid transferase